MCLLVHFHLRFLLLLALAKGDKIIVFRPGTEQWIKDLKMDQIEEREGTNNGRRKNMTCSLKGS